MSKSPGLNSVFLTIEAFLLLFGQLGRINMPYGISFYVLEAVVFFHILYLFLMNPKGLTNLKNNTLAKIGLVWIFFVCLTLVVQSFSFTLSENIRAISYLLRVSNFAVFAFFVIPNTSGKISKNIVTAISILLSLIALVQYVFLPDLRFLASYGWDPHMYRAVGTILDPPIMGSFLGMLFVHRLILGIEKTAKMHNSIKSIFDNKKRFGYAVTSVAVLLAIVFLYSRSTYLSVIIAVNYVLLANRKYLHSLAFTLAFVAAIVLAPKTIPAYSQLESAKLERISTVTSRKTEILTGLSAFAENPIWGVGFNRVREYKEKVIGARVQRIDEKRQTTQLNNHAGSAFHSFWVTQAATTGILGLGLIVWFFAEMIRKKPQFRPIIFIPAFIGLFDNTLFHPFVLINIIFLYANFQRIEYST